MVVTESFEAPLGSFFRRQVVGWNCTSAVVVVSWEVILTFDIVKKNLFFFFVQSLKISVLLFKDGLDVRMENCWLHPVDNLPFDVTFGKTTTTAAQSTGSASPNVWST